MFDTLIASKPKRNSLLNSRTATASVAIHVVLLGGIAYAAVNAPEAMANTVEEVTFVDIQPEPEPVRPETPPPPEPEAPEPAPEEPAVLQAPEVEPVQVEERAPDPEPAPEAPVAKGFQDLAPPAEVASKLPEVDPSARAVRAEDFSGVGVAGGASTGVKGGASRNTASEAPKSAKGSGGGEGDGSPVDVAVVEERPELQNRAEMQRVLQRMYPALLRDAGITGTAQLRFVIGTDGRVEPGSIDVLSSSHDGFADASKQAARQLRFRPARIGDRKVRVLISMPITWTLDR